MKLEDMILVVENRKGTETNYLLNLTDYMETVVKLWGENAEDMAGAIGTLYETKAGKREWSDLYYAANKSIHASFCTGETQLSVFLNGMLNDGEWSFDTERCSKDCLDVLRIYNLKPDGLRLFPSLHYERVEHTFHVGEMLHNMNGNDYRVLAVLSPKNLLLMSAVDGQIPFAGLTPTKLLPSPPISSIDPRFFIVFASATTTRPPLFIGRVSPPSQACLEITKSLSA